MLKRKVARRSSAQYYVTAEDHVENEMKHERLLTEASRLSSSWASLSVSCSDTPEKNCALSASAHSSPCHRPSSFSGPLVISVTCSNSSCSGTVDCGATTLSANPRCTSSSPLFSKSTSCYPSPAASPVSSRFHCCSPSLNGSNNSPNPRRHYNTGGASPLLVTTALGRKRGYLASTANGGNSSDEVSRDSSPDIYPCFKNNKSLRPSDARSSSNAPSQSDYSLFRWPPSSANGPGPSGLSCQLFSSNIHSSDLSNSPPTLSFPPAQLSTVANTPKTNVFSLISSTCTVSKTEPKSTQEHTGQMDIDVRLSRPLSQHCSNSTAQI